LDKEKVQAAHAAELSENKIDFMRQENARLTDQISELKAALYKRVEASQEPATK
jgi:chaperonin cofactor prefoldin